jgi:uncharacterized protein (DUF427 family)
VRYRGVHSVRGSKRIRAVLDGGTVVDTTRALLVWEPRRIVPSYAVPADDIAAELAPAGTAATDAAGTIGAHTPELSGRPVLDPSVPFAVHSAEGHAADLRAGEQDRPGAGFYPTDPDLAGYVVLDFGAFDAWYEEDERNVAHPRDPFHRVDVLPSSRHVRVELDGHVLAESSRPALLFETMLPTRYYLPPDDIRTGLTTSSTRTWCAYKGQASYWSAAAGDRVVPTSAGHTSSRCTTLRKSAASSPSSTSGSTSSWTVNAPSGPSPPGRLGRAPSGSAEPSELAACGKEKAVLATLRPARLLMAVNFSGRCAGNWHCLAIGAKPGRQRSGLITRHDQLSGRPAARSTMSR